MYFFMLDGINGSITPSILDWQEEREGKQELYGLEPDASSSREHSVRHILILSLPYPIWK